MLFSTGTHCSLRLYDLYSQHQTGRTLTLAERRSCSLQLLARRSNRSHSIILVSLDCLQACSSCQDGAFICFEHNSGPSIPNIHEIAAAILKSALSPLVHFQYNYPAEGLPLCAICTDRYNTVWGSPKAGGGAYGSEKWIKGDEDNEEP